LWGAAKAAEANAEWINFDDMSRSVRIGRYSYIIVDCSGLIDLNFDYSTTNYTALPRWLGHSPYELQMDPALLQELSASWRNMILARVYRTGKVPAQGWEKPWVRMETAAEIVPFLGAGFGSIAQQPFAVRTNFNFVTYSHFPRGYLDSATVRDQIPLGGTFTTLLSNQVAIVSALTAMGVSDAGALFNNIRDYVDPDHQPFDRNSFGTEAVPLINEIVVSNRLSQGGGVVSNQLQVMVEVWFPFTTTNSSSFSLRIGALNSGATPSTLAPAVSTAPIALPAGAWTPGRIAVVTSPVAVATTTNAYDLSDWRISLAIRLYDGAGQEVDLVGANSGAMVPIYIGELIGGVGGYQRGRAANDPRLNWNGADSGQWIDRLGAQITLGSINSTITATNAGGDGHTLMYVANRPLETIAELGLLLHDRTRHWQTISLLDGPNFLPILDRFVLSTNSPGKGLINPNSYNSNVIATVFNNMPIERVPGDPLTVRATVADARSLASQFANKTIAFTNLSDFRYGSVAISNALPVIAPAAYESVVRNSAGLFSPRQQLFTVVLAADVLVENTTNVLASRRGVGLVWRDPYPVNGRNDIRIRNFRWLTE